VRYGALALEVDREVRLVPRHPNDAPEMFALVDRLRMELREWLPWVDATRTLHDVRRYAQFAESQFKHHATFDYGIRVGGALCGAIGLHNIDWASRSAHIGYWLAPEQRGRGVMTRAGAALTTHAVRSLEIHRIEIRCVIENRPSRAVAERLGYRLEGTLAQAYFLHGTFRDIALYATTAGEWGSRLDASVG
jgi:ribosomal-protein-serine acetyltransferase